MKSSGFRRWLELCLASLILLTVGSVDAVAQTKHRVMLSDLDTLKQADYLQLSPDGTMLAYTLDGNLWLLKTEPGRRPRKLGKASLPHWPPDGKRLAYSSSAS